MFNLGFVILISTIVCSDSYDIGIKARIFDPAGRETSLLYDGGSIEISCWQIGDNGGKTLRLKSSKGSYDHNLAHANGSCSTLQYNISISFSSLKTSYRCTVQGYQSSAIEISYVICNPMSVKPRKVCSEIGKFCRVRDKGLTECKRMNEYSCRLGLSGSAISDSSKQLLPNFNVACGRNSRTEYGLCHSLADSPDQLVRFVTNDIKRCDLGFQLYICGKDCKSKKNPTVMTGWRFVDVAKPFSIYVQLKSKTRSSTVSCDIAYAKNGEIMSKKVTFKTGNKKSYNADAIPEELQQLSTPIIADMVCDVIYKNDTLLRYQTNLLVFRSDKDFHYKVTELVELDSDKKTNKFIINVTAADGLLVCAEKGKGCNPTEETTKRTTMKKVEFKQGDKDLGAFYIGLFASSPKRKYVRIHDEILRLTAHKSNIKNNVTDSGGTTRKPDTKNDSSGSGKASHRPSVTNLTTGSGKSTHNPDTRNNATGSGSEVTPKKTDSDNGWKIGFAVALVIGTITVVATITIAALCARQKKLKQRRHQGNESGALPPNPLTKSPLKDVQAIPSLDSVAMSSSQELVTRSFPNIPLKSPSKETEKAQPYSQAEQPYTSEISINAYETIYPKAHH